MPGPGYPSSAPSLAGNPSLTLSSPMPPVRVPPRSGRVTCGLPVPRPGRGLSRAAFMGCGGAQGGGGSAFFGGYVGSLQGAGGPAFMGPGFAQGGGGPAFVGAGSGHGYGGGASFHGGSEFMGGYGGGASFHGGTSSFQGDTSSFDGGYDSHETPTGRRGTGAGRGGRRRNARRRVEDDSVRAAWTPELTKTFCDIFCAVMDSGNDKCVRGKMTPHGWREVGTRFRKATALVHREGQFTYIYNKLRKEWNYIVGKLRNGSGLGRGAGKTATADEFWWKKEAEGDPDILKLKDAMPEYIDEMEKMFSGHVADGSTSYAPGQRTVHDIPSDDADNEDEQDAQEAEEGDDDLFAQDATDVATPASVGSKRSSSGFSKRTSGGFSTPSLRSTGSSPNKKVKSPAVNAMTSSLGGLREVIHGNRHHVDGTLTAVRAERQAGEALHQARVAERAAAEERMLRRLEAAEQKKKEQQDRVDEIIRLAAEVGVDDTSPDYEGLMRIIQCDNAMQLFIRSGTEGRKRQIHYYATEGRGRAAARDTYEEQYLALLQDQAAEDEEYLAFLDAEDAEDDAVQDQLEDMVLGSLEIEQAAMEQAMEGIHHKGKLL